MKLTIFLTCVLCFQSLAGALAQKVDIQVNNKSLKSVIQQLQRQSGYSFVLDEAYFTQAKPVTLSLKGVEILDALPYVFADQPFDYQVEGKVVYFAPKRTASRTDSHNLQQQRAVTGRVTDEQGNPLEGVTVRLKGTNVATTTNAEGTYKINDVSSGSEITYSIVGFDSMEIRIVDKVTINVSMKATVSDIEEVVVVGYGTQKKSDLTGSIHRVDASQYETQSTTNLIDMLNGTVAGFNSNQGRTAAGGGSTEIRGPNSIAASNSPLLVLDGVIFNGNISDINPSDIETIDILKDASAAAVFGARSAAGVLIITTKRGKIGKPEISVSADAGLVGTTHLVNSFGPAAYLQARATVLRQIYPNRPYEYYTNPDQLPANITLNEWKNYDITPSDDPVGMWLNRLSLSPEEQENYLANKTTNWSDLVFQNGIRQNYDVSIAGGGKDARYFFSGGYTHNEGNVVGDVFKTFRSRVNIDTDIASFLKIGVNAQFKDEDNSAVPASFDTNYERQSPYGKVYNDDGTMTWFPNNDNIAANPLSLATHRDKFTKRQALFATFFADIALPFDISYRVSFQNRYAWVKDYLFDPLETARGANNGGIGSRNNSSINEWMVDNILNWNRTFSGIHKFDLTFLFNVEKYQGWSDSQQNLQIMPSTVLGYHALHAGSHPTLENDDNYSTGNALMGRINYSLKDTYLLTATLRRDGYSAFGAFNPYAVFPSLAVGWRVSNESFFNKQVINDLKLRFSWGANGNRDIGRYAALATLGSTDYLYDNTPASGVNSTKMENAGLRWEKTGALNAGLDFGILGNRISGSIEGYHMITTDLLLDRSLPSIIGYNSVTANLGKIRNKGVELTINSVNINRENAFQWNSSFVFSLNRNRILQLYGDMVDLTDANGNVIGQKEADDVGNQWFIGQALDRIWDYELLGIWQPDEKDRAQVFGRVPGDHKLADINGDSVLSPLEDKVFQGYARPRYRLGFRNDISFLNGFQLSFFIRADVGFHRNNPLYKNTHFLDRVNYYSVPYWTPDNPGNDWPRLDPTVSSPAFNVWKNSSFIRLQDLSLAYNIPGSKLKRHGLQRVRAYVALRNYVTLTSWNYWDPETGNAPMPKNVTVGLDFSL